jgi:putative transposase
MIQREGFEVNHKKMRRIYRVEKLQVRRGGDRKRAFSSRRQMAVLDGPNQRCSLNFLSDSFTAGRGVRILAIVDDHTSENAAQTATLPYLVCASRGS